MPLPRSRCAAFLLTFALFAPVPLRAATPPRPAPPVAVPTNPDFHYIDSALENGSPLHWDVQADGSILISLHYDHERASPNRAAGHWHFRLEGRPGATLTLVLQNFHNVWNGRAGLPVDPKTPCAVSEDGRSWRTEPMEFADARVRLRVTLPASGSLYLARLEPYRLSDLDRLLAEIRPHPLVDITTIGRTVEGRPLEIIRAGRPDAPYRIFLRARAHPWEPGGNWVVQGLLRALLADTPSAVRARAVFCAYVMPMANKDGVARGLTRFNVRGRDLNRNWDQPAPADLAPENHALEQWLLAQNARGLRPHFALELHNDAGGKLHLSRPNIPDLAAYLANLQRFESLLRQHTWFTEGSTGSQFRNPGTLGDGWLERFGIPAVVLEFNSNWIAGKQKTPLGADWEEFGRNLLPVFCDFFAPPPAAGKPAP
jgi:hypothetical protein